MPLKNPQSTIFYAIEKAIKTYRQFAQRNIDESGIDITLDQALLMRAIQDFPDASQSAIADLIFKDYASVTRMVELLVKKGCLSRSFHQTDRRRHILRLSAQGKTKLKHLDKIVERNRLVAKNGLTAKELNGLRSTLNKLIENCN